jgi:amino acid transporter
MPFWEKILGRRLSVEERKKQELTIITGVPALGLDSLASTAYGPEAALLILLPLGLSGLHFFLTIQILIVIILLSLYLSYQQTAAAYPGGGGAYNVACDNLGKKVGIWAAVALLLDYLLNVAVGISAGIGAIVSAIPGLQPYTLTLCLLVLFMLTLFNLRGIRETGIIFVIPTLLFIFFLAITMGIGMFHLLMTPGDLEPVVALPPPPAPYATVSLWLLLGAFANGLTAMTGVEAVSNAVPLFRKPRVRNARWTLTIIIGVLALFLIILGYLCPAYHIVAMDQKQSGYQSVLSQLVAAVCGRGVFYHISLISIFILLIYSAQTSFADFPRVCRFLARDRFLPPFFAEQGRRLVFSLGILILAILSAILLIVFQGITANLIPLFAIGAFSAFVFSQVGMTLHWIQNQGPRWQIKCIFNALGAFVTSIALIIIITTKFKEGAWIILFLAPALVFLLKGIQNHYKDIRKEIQKPLELQLDKVPPFVIIPIQGWNRVAERALKFGFFLSDEVMALHVTSQKDNNWHLKKIWKEKVEKPCATLYPKKIPKLEIIYSPYRQFYKSIIDYVNQVKKERPNQLIAVVIPELVEAHWYEHLLHNVHAAGLRALLFFERDQRVVVVTVPWYLRE